MQLLGTVVAQQLLQQLHEKIAYSSRAPHLAIILVGSNEASHIYVRVKQKTLHAIGIKTTLYTFDTHVSQVDIITKIQELNLIVDGILIQLPLPKHLDTAACIAAIDPTKDVDGLHPWNMGKLLRGEEGFVPCTPLGVLKLLQHYHIHLEGKHIVVIGRSNIVGKPLAALCMQKHPEANATVTIVHSHTPSVATFTRQADIIVAACGVPYFLKADMITQEAIVVDVGIHRVNQELIGDVDIAAQKKCAAISPVPGGVGPMTVACLASNLYKSFSQSCGLSF